MKPNCDLGPHKEASRRQKKNRLSDSRLKRSSKRRNYLNCIQRCVFRVRHPCAKHRVEFLEWEVTDRKDWKLDLMVKSNRIAI